MKNYLQSKVEEEHTQTTYTPPQVEMLKIKVEAGFAETSPSSITADVSDKQVTESGEDW